MEWHYTHNEQQLGPVSEDEFSALLENGTVTLETYVWRAGMEQWAQYGTLADAVPASSDIFEPSDLSPLAAESAGFESGLISCAECGELFDSSELIKYQDRHVCGSCKSVFFQRIKEGGEHATVFEYGGFWIRLAAKFLDGIIGNVVVYGLLFIMGTVFSGMANEASPVLFFMTLFISYGIPLAYTTFFIGKYGATPGKMAAGLKVVRPDGEPVSYARAFGRHFAEMLSGLILAIGYIMAAFDDEKRSLHDRICDTRVIKVK